MPASPSPVRGVILDVDGTLIDSNDAHVRAWIAAFGEEGLDVPFGRVRPLIGMGGDQLVPEVLGEDADSARGERVRDAWKRHFLAEEVEHLEPQPGARALVEGLLARGARVVIGSSADKSLLGELLDRAGLADLDLPATTASDVEASKPEPDIVRAAVDKLGLSPDEVLMVGDTPFDAESARRAGVRTVLLRCGGDDRLEEAAAVYDDPADLAAHLEAVLSGEALSDAPEADAGV